jgi:hypothetical protein
MNLILASLWPALALSGAVGLVLASFGGSGRGLPSAGWPVMALAALALLAGIALAWLRLVPGAAGLWLDLAVLLASAYAAGVVLGTLLRRLVRGGREKDDPEGDTPPTVTPA